MDDSLFGDGGGAGGYDDDIKNQERGIDEAANPLVELVLTFLTAPSSSLPAQLWGVALALIVLLQYLCISLESMQLQSFAFLPSESVFWQLYIAYSVPLAFDASLRVLVLFFVLYRAENRLLRSILQKDVFTQWLLAADVLCVVPFVVNVAALKAAHSPPLPQGARVILRILEVSSGSRILRLAKELPSIKAFTMALSRSLPKLVLPCFFFLLLVTTAANVLYFVEPCYDVTACPWKDLLGASFFAASVMTNTGFGNQIPKYEYARFVTVMVMLSGMVLLALPLAIIGNEYADACIELMQEGGRQGVDLDLEQDEEDDQSVSNSKGMELVWEREALRSSSLMDKAGTEADFLTDADLNSNAGDPLHNKEQHQQQQRQRQRAHQELVATIYSFPVVEAHTRLTDAAERLTALCDDTRRVTPTVLNAIYVLDTWVDPLLKGLEDVIEGATKAAATEAAFEAMAQAETGITPALSKLSEQGMATLKRTAHDSFGIDGESFSLAPDDPSKQGLDEIISDSHAEHLNPHPISLSFRGRMWLFLHAPSSSRKALAFRVVLLVFIAASVLMQYTETLSGFNVYDEPSQYCEAVVALYCRDKSYDTDPGCYVQSTTSGSGKTPPPLYFFCTSPNCYGQARNFGSPRSSISCASAAQPFQTLQELTYHYGAAGMFSSRVSMTLRSPVCTRMECAPKSDFYLDASAYWFYGELATCSFFGLEVVLRIFAAASLKEYLFSAINWCDLLSLVPFFTEIAYAGGTSAIDFSVLSSSPLPAFLMIAKSLKIFRLLKVARYLHASRTLAETLSKTLQQLAGILGLTLVIVTLAAITLYEIEGGTECFVGDVGCKVPAFVTQTSHNGDRVMINANGELSGFPNAFAALWFAFVTISLTGFGDAVPVTYGGKFVNVFLMIGALCDVALPVTVTASTFFHVHQRYENKEHRAMIGERSRQSRQRRSEARALARLQPVVSDLSDARQHLTAFLDLLQRPPPTRTAAQLIVHLPADADKSHLLQQVADLARTFSTHLASCRRDMLTLVYLSVKREMSE